jgi:hypothetical protein
MPIPQRLEKSQWSKFCDRFSKELTGKRAEIEVASLDMGVQIATQRLPVVGLMYDFKDDLFVIVLDGVEHLVFRPREIYVEYQMGGIANLGILDDSSTWQIVVLRDPLMLPAPR